MTLYEGSVSKQYEILGVYAQENITRRLEALGLNDGTVIQVLNRKGKGAMIIKVRGTRLALGRHILEGIEIKER